MIDVPGMFGALVFGDNVMKAMLPKGVYEALRKTGKRSALGAWRRRRVVAAMKEWQSETALPTMPTGFNP